MSCSHKEHIGQPSPQSAIILLNAWRIFVRSEPALYYNDGQADPRGAAQEFQDI